MNLKQSSKMCKAQKKIPLLMHVGELASIFSPYFRKPSKEIIFSLEIVNLHLETRNLSLDGLFGIFKLDPQEKLDGI